MIFEVIRDLNSFFWGYLLIFLLAGTGLYYTFLLKFVQVRRFGESIKKALGGASIGEEAGESGMNSFQSLTTAIAAQVGTGNLAGAATAIVSGGPGAIFWMWVTAFFGMATIFAEAVLAQVFKKEIKGHMRGGPAFYIQEGIKNKTAGRILASFFSVSIIVALGFVGNMVQANSIANAVKGSFDVNPLYIGVVVAILAGLVFKGGVKSIASFTEKVIPLMSVMYVGGALLILFKNLPGTIEAFRLIFACAFTPEAATGGVLGVTVKQAVRYGVARGLFSNEAGMGSTPHAHAIAKVPHPCDQGLVAMFGVFFDTFVILTLTSLLIIANTPLGGGGFIGIELTQQAFIASLGSAGGVFISVALFFFGFSTIVGWYFFGEANIRFLFGSDRATNVYTMIVLICIVVATTIEVPVIWELADFFNGLMIFPNLVALIIMSKRVRDKLVDYEK